MLLFFIYCIIIPMKINYKMFFASIFAVLVLVILNASFFQHKAKADSSNYQYVNITSSDISQAGYSGVSQQSPEKKHASIAESLFLGK